MLIIEICKNIKWSVEEKIHRKYFNYSEEQFVKELSAWYKDNLGRELDLCNPVTFNNKIQWLKLFDSTDLKAQLADKLECRSWVADTIGEQYLIPLFLGETVRKLTH